MAFSKKTWVDRLVEFAGRRKITNVSTMQAQIVDVERAEGTVSQEGSAFSAQTMNDLEQRIADGFSSVEKSVNQVSSEIADAKQELGGIEYGTVTVTSAVTADLKGVHKINKTAYLTLHAKAVTHALTSGIAHFQSSIPPASPTYIPYFIMNGTSSRVQLAYMDQNGNISLAGGDDININEWFLFSTSYRTN